MNDGDGSHTSAVMELIAGTRRVAVIVSLGMSLGIVAVTAACAQSGKDVGSAECRQFQLAVQAALGKDVTSANPVRNDFIGALSTRLGTAVASGQITTACANCILDQFARRVPVTGQASCGRPEPTPTAPAPRTPRPAR